MTAYIVQNTSEAEAPPEPPEGSVYAFEMVYDGGRTRAWADSPEELIDALIPGYLGMDLDDRLRARLHLALQVKATTQASLNVGNDLGSQPVEVVSALNSGVVAPQITTWSSPLPLIVLDLHYMPYSNLAAPIADGEGNLLWFKANDEDDFLTSLYQAGFISLARRTV